MPIMLLYYVILPRVIMPHNELINKMSKILNRNFRCKIGRTLYGYSGACRLLGRNRIDHIIQKAMRCKDDVFRYRVSSLGLTVSLYAK